MNYISKLSSLIVKQLEKDKSKGIEVQQSIHNVLSKYLNTAYASVMEAKQSYEGKSLSQRVALNNYVKDRLAIQMGDFLGREKALHFNEHEDDYFRLIKAYLIVLNTNKLGEVE